MNRFVLIACVLLGAAGVVWTFPGRVVSPDGGLPPLPPSMIEISLNDPGESAAIKFMALEAAGLAPEARTFAERIRNNATSKEFAGAGPAAEAWREIAQDVRRAAQQGLSNKILSIQDEPLPEGLNPDQKAEEYAKRWIAAADYLESASTGWANAAAALTKLAAKSRK